MFIFRNTLRKFLWKHSSNYYLWLLPNLWRSSCSCLDFLKPFIFQTYLWYPTLCHTFFYIWIYRKYKTDTILMLKEKYRNFSCLGFKSCKLEENGLIWELTDLMSEEYNTVSHTYGEKMLAYFKATCVVIMLFHEHIIDETHFEYIFK